MGQIPTNLDLAGLQKLLYRLITAPEGVASGLAAEGAHALALLESLIEVDDRLSAAERLEIYANAYFYRILDCLKEDFPATLSTIGPDNFHNLITGYLIDYPPTEPSISHAGRHLSEFLHDHPLCSQWPFIADLAHLERTIVEVFHAPDAVPLGTEEMRSVAPANWPELALRTYPALAILESEWRVDELIRASEHAGGSVKSGNPLPARESVTILVWRQNCRVRYRPLGQPERAGLYAARSRSTFGAVCEAISGAYEGRDVVAEINRLLAGWLADGMLINDKESTR